MPFQLPQPQPFPILDANKEILNLMSQEGQAEIAKYQAIEEMTKSVPNLLLQLGNFYERRKATRDLAEFAMQHFAEFSGPLQEPVTERALQSRAPDLYAKLGVQSADGTYPSYSDIADQYRKRRDDQVRQQSMVLAGDPDLFKAYLNKNFDDIRQKERLDVEKSIRGEDRKARLEIAKTIANSRRANIAAMDKSQLLRELEGINKQILGTDGIINEKQHPEEFAGMVQRKADVMFMIQALDAARAVAPRVPGEGGPTGFEPPRADGKLHVIFNGQRGWVSQDDFNRNKTRMKRL